MPQGIVAWLDKDSSYTRFVDDLATRHVDDGFTFPVVGFRGSFLELLFALEPYRSGLDRQPLLLDCPWLDAPRGRKAGADKRRTKKRGASAKARSFADAARRQGRSTTRS